MGYFLLGGMRLQGQRCIRMVNACVRIRVYAHIKSHTDLDSFSYLDYGSSTKVSLMIPMT